MPIIKIIRRNVKGRKNCVVRIAAQFLLNELKKTRCTFFLNIES